jgi:glycosyltransferase involved in cell wall biosynthesis
VAAIVVCAAMVAFGAVNWTLNRVSPPSPSPSSHPQSTLLIVMVRNEERVIGRLLRSAYGAIATRLLLCDTGSTDGTMRAAAQAWNGGNTSTMARYDVPGGFVNFEQSRNACNEAAKRLLEADTEIKWVALADADFEVYVRAHEQENEPSADVNTIQIHGTPHNQLNMLVRASVFASSCRYRLWTHEFLDCSGGSGTTTTTIPFSQSHYAGFYYVDHADGSSRVHKLKRDIRLLTEWLEQVNEPDIRARALYYLARAYEDSDELERAYKAYEEHNREQPYTNYLFYARYRMALIRVKQNATLDVVERHFLDAHAEYDGYFRREPLYYLAWLHRIHGHWSKCVLYASAALGAPKVNHARMPLFLEMNVYGAEGDARVSGELDECVLKWGT